MANFHEQSGLSYPGWGFECSWPVRAESALDIAERIQALARRLGKFAPVYGELWPLFAMRGPRATEPHVLQLSADELGSLIERRARFDPPRWPKPVGPDGYSVALTTNNSGYDPMNLGLIVRAGACRDGPNPGTAKTLLPQDSPVWRDPELGRGMLVALVEAFEPRVAFCGAPYARKADGEPGGYRFRPWFGWAADGERLPDHLDPPGLPAWEEEDRGGRLFFWP